MYRLTANLLPPPPALASLREMVPAAARSCTAIGPCPGCGPATTASATRSASRSTALPGADSDGDAAAGAPACCATCATSCANSRLPSVDEGSSLPSAKKTSCPCVNASAPSRPASAAAASSSWTRTSPSGTPRRDSSSARTADGSGLPPRSPDSGSTPPSFCASASRASLPAAVVRPASSCSAVARMRWANESAAAPSTLVSWVRSALPSSSFTSASTSFLASPWTASTMPCVASYAASCSGRVVTRGARPSAARTAIAVRARSRAKRSPRPSGPMRRSTRCTSRSAASDGAPGLPTAAAPRCCAAWIASCTSTEGSPPPAPANTSCPTVNAGVPSRAVSASTAGPDTSCTPSSDSPSAASATSRASDGSAARLSPRATNASVHTRAASAGPRSRTISR